MSRGRTTAVHLAHAQASEGSTPSPATILAKRGEEDLLFFVAHILGYGEPLDPLRPYLRVHAEPGSCHEGLARFIQSADERSVTESLDMEPRGFLKTTIGTIGYVLWRLAKNPNERILLVAATAEKAAAYLEEIKGQCANNSTLLSLFPHLAPGDPWRHGYATISGRTIRWKDPSVKAVSIEQGKAGGHYDRIVCDDLHDEANSATAEQCQKIITQYQRLRPLLVDQRRGEIRSTATLWNRADVTAWMMERNAKAREKGEAEPVLIRVSKLYGENGEPAWPEMYGREQIELLRASMDPEIFYMQYMNEASNEGSAVFRQSDIDKATVRADELPAEGLNYFALVDPAFATNRWNDYSAIVVVGKHHAGYVFVVDIYRERAQLTALFEALWRMHAKWRFTIAGIEMASAGIAIETPLRDYARDHGQIPWVPINHRGGGHSAAAGKSRIRKIEPYLRNGTLRFVRSCPNYDVLTRELRDYPGCPHDDVADALAFFPEIVFAPPNPGIGRGRERAFEPATWDQWLKLAGTGGSYDGVAGGVPDSILVGGPT